MLKIKGTIKGVRLAMTQNGIGRQVVIDFADDAVLDELQEVMRCKARLNIIIEPEQLAFGGRAEDIQ